MFLTLTRKTSLAIRVLREMSGGDRHRSGDLAAAVGASPTYLPQVVAPLLGAGWVQSSFGPGGGYRLSPQVSGLSLLDVIEAIEGPLGTGRCLLDDRSCPSAAPCDLHAGWQRGIDALIAELRRTPLGIDGGTLPSRPGNTEGNTTR
jgi:Rrf2 family protein